MDNPLNRYLVNDRSRLTPNADGSLDVYLQRTAPASAAQQRNWLPTPPGAFRLNLRLYGLSETSIAGLAAGEGWRPPSVLPCLANGRTEENAACVR